MTKKRKLTYSSDDLAKISFTEYSHEAKQSRKKIGLDTLARYSDCEIELFQKFVLLTNFPVYVEKFAELHNVNIHAGPVLRVAHCPKTEVSIIDYRVGAPMAALVIDALSYTAPHAAIMLGMCGGLHRYHEVGDFFLPMAAIRDEGVSKHYMPQQVPSLPAFLIQHFISTALSSNGYKYKTGVIHTTDYRMWEFNQEFCNNLVEEKASAIDMECSALFSSAFKQKVPIGALMLISDLPLQPGGVKTQESAKSIFADYTDAHLACSLKAVAKMRESMSKEDLNFRRFLFDSATL